LDYWVIGLFVVFIMLKVALTGSTGLIGSRIIEILKDKFEFIQIFQSEADITDKNSIQDKINSLDFDIFLHLAAYTNVDAAETQKELAHSINVLGTQNVYDAVTAKNKKFIYISTDFVFDGTKPPYYEDSIPNPLSYYAQTKLEGEKIVRGKTMIVRLSYPYRSHYELKKDFVMGIHSALEQKKMLTMISDSIITPTFIDDIALSFEYLFNNFSQEIFHIVGSDSLSPYEASLKIAKIFTLDQSLITPISYNEYYKYKAKRPQYSEMKTKNNDFYKMRTFEEGLAEIKAQISKFKSQN
jgi:dTDP-4-dehydrorhamnose reductase